MKKYLSILLICLCLLLVSCGKGNPKDFDIKLASTDGEDLAEELEEWFEDLEDKPLPTNAAWYNVKVSGYNKSSYDGEDYDSSSEAEYVVSGSIYVGENPWETKAHLTYKFSGKRVEDGEVTDIDGTYEITWLDGTGYLKMIQNEKSDDGKAKEKSYERTHSFSGISSIPGGELISYLFDPIKIFEDLLSVAIKAEKDSDDYDCEVYKEDDEYAYTYEYEYDNELFDTEENFFRKLQFKYDSEKNLIKSIDYYHKNSRETESQSSESCYSVKIDKALFGIILKPLNHADYTE